jgi:Carboxypeptidase regulatory-like domain
MKLFRVGVVVAFLLTFVFANFSAGQSLTSGDIVGRIIDPAGAVVSGAAVSLKSLDYGTEQAGTTNSDGSFHFTLLKPGRYEISTSVSGFARAIRNVVVDVGGSTKVEIVLEITKQAETIEVTTDAPLINTDPGSATTYTQAEVALLPTPGGDLTTLAFTAPGVVVSPGTGYGNFTANGLPGTSNLFTVNGENDMDPYFNINNSGAVNLTLGANEVQEVTVTTNPYAGQYGQLMGAQVSYVTKSGSNSFHGNAQYWWNGRFLNANDFFNNATDTPRAFSNANQWAGAIGGPIIKDKLFFFFDTEGLRFVLPNNQNITVPTPDFASAVLSNIQAVSPNQLPTYQTIFGLYANAAQGKTPTSVTQSPGCLPGIVPGWTTGDCSELITVSPSALAHEWIIASRIDYKLTSKDDLFFRFKIDHGLQPTYLDPVSPSFNALSNQPAYDYQVQEHHVFNGAMANEFTATLSHYVAQFAQNTSEVQATLPYALNFASNIDFTSFNPSYDFPQGRNITQYQLIDNFTWTKGKHSLQFGVNFRRYDVSDHNFFFNSPLVYFRNIATTGPLANGMADFANGLSFQYRQADNLASDVPVALWGLGAYASDTWKVTPTFTLTAALRVEHNSNPVCQINCFANFVGDGSFNGIASVAAANAGNDPGAIPYNQDIATGLHQAYKGVDALVYSPRLAFSWAPGSSNRFPYFPGGGKTVISGGIGIFYDNPAAGLVDNLLANPPVSVMFRIRPPTGTAAFDPTNTGSAYVFQQASQAFNVSKSYNQIEQELGALNVNFPAPAFDNITGTIHAPQAQEWNLKLDQQVTKSTAFSVNYVGNHVIRLPFSNAYPNATDCYGIFAAVPGVNENCFNTGNQYGVVPNYGTVSNYQSGAVSNYNGITVSIREQYHSWFLGHFNYTFSHTLDEVSNGGLFTINADQIPLEQNNPTSLRAGNYGNADYDIRHLISGDFVISPQFHFENKFAKTFIGGWQFAGKLIWRTGLPFTLVDGNLNGLFLDGGGTIFANQITGAIQTSCGKANVATNAVSVGCVNSNAFTNTADPSFSGYSAWPSQARNQLRGPSYFDMDMSLFKNFAVTERANLGIGITAFNAFNHPNFGQPDNTLGDGTTGQIFGMMGVPSSPYGNFLGFDSSPRVVQLTAKFTF